MEDEMKVSEHERTFVSKAGFEFRVTLTKVYDPLASVDAVVTFWDVKTNVLAATYYLKSLLSRRRTDWGFSLHTQVPEWTIDDETMQKVDTFLLAPNSEISESEPATEESPVSTIPSTTIEMAASHVPAVESAIWCLDFTNSLIEHTEVVNNPELTQKLRDWGGGTEVQDDLRILLGLLKGVMPECDHRDERGFTYGVEIIEKGQRIGHHYDYCPKCGIRLPSPTEES